MSEDYVKHLAALHHGWETPLSIVAAAVGEVATAPVAEQSQLGGLPSCVRCRQGNENFAV